MRVAICGYFPLATQIIHNLKSINVECTHFVREFISNRVTNGVLTPPPITPVSFFDFRRLIKSGELEGIIIAEDARSAFTFEVVKILKLYDVPNVGVINFDNPFQNLRWLNSEKIYMKQLEANVIDSCNLNCKGCTHYSNLFGENDVYPISDYARDLRQIADCVDVSDFFILGGEPFKLQNLDQYLRITRRLLPTTNLRLVTNGLLVPSLTQNILDALRENKFVVDISMYPPTVRMIDKISEVFRKNNIPHNNRDTINFFNTFLTFHGGHNPQKARAVCCNDGCRFLRNGKIYKCPIDALSFKFAEHFGIKGFPESTGVDIFAKNFSAQIEKLDGNIELCTWCSESVRRIQWTPEHNPKITDWLANPDEINNFLPK